MRIIENYSLAAHSSLKIGGAARRALFPENETEALELVTSTPSAPVFGRGSNVLFPDGGIDGDVIFTDKLRGIAVDADNLLVTAEVGVTLFSLCSACARQNLGGIEFLYGIPGSVGGAVFMNAGAYGGEIGERIISVKTNLREYSKTECKFSYRHSVFQASHEVILSCALKLECRPEDEIRAKMSEFLEKRKSAQPLDLPNVGSVWKRQGDIIPAKLIDDAELKGLTVGVAQISEKHAGFIVIIGKSQTPAADVKELMRTVEARIFERYGVKLTREVIVVE